MFSYISNAINFSQFVEEFGTALGVPVNDGRLEFPSSFAKGYMQVETLPNGLLALEMDYILNTDFIFDRPSSEEEIYSLRFDNIEIRKQYVTKIDDEYRSDDMETRDAVYLMCSLFDLGYISTKGTHINCVMIQFNREWMGKYLQMDSYDKILQHYLSLKTTALDMEHLDADYRQAMEEIQQMNTDHPAHVTMIHNRIMHMLERFFITLYEKRHQLTYQIKATNEDIVQVRKVEKIITSNFTAPFPSIEELAKAASMSSSKLKKLFKDVYGKPIYQYYQQHRMNKARAMLISQQYSVKNVGLSLGYTNLSNFSMAFRKEFKMLPSDLVKN
ncbi:MAG: AraC family transcriptional regulator [Chitinophagaceae bacterium]